MLSWFLYPRERLQNLKSLWILPISDSGWAPSAALVSLIKEPEVRRRIVESIPTGLCVLDSQKKIVLWSDGAERITETSVMKWSDDHASQNRFCIATRPVGNIARKSVRWLKP